MANGLRRLQCGAAHTYLQKPTVSFLSFLSEHTFCASMRTWKYLHADTAYLSLRLSLSLFNLIIGRNVNDILMPKNYITSLNQFSKGRSIRLQTFQTQTISLSFLTF